MAEPKGTLPLDSLCCQHNTATSWIRAQIRRASCYPLAQTSTKTNSGSCVIDIGASLLTRTECQHTASLYETTLDAVKQITYVKPALPANTKIPLSKPISEHTFVNRVISGGKLDPAAPVEVYVHRELTNPHSRAKKQARWQAQQRHRRLLLEQMMVAEVKSLKGRTKRVARMEAVWKWKNLLIEERKAELERRRVNRGEVARQETRKIMKARKAARIDRQLQNMVLTDAPNQIVPESQPSA